MRVVAASFGLLVARVGALLSSLRGLRVAGVRMRACVVSFFFSFSCSFVVQVPFSVLVFGFLLLLCTPRASQSMVWVSWVVWASLCVASCQAMGLLSYCVDTIFVVNLCSNWVFAAADASGTTTCLLLHSNMIQTISTKNAIKPPHTVPKSVEGGYAQSLLKSAVLKFLKPLPPIC
ncbi:hypothetical protein U1Q18_021562 [Sarracenia purpurea var. burkii]